MFAHLLDTGGGRRTWLSDLDKVSKCYLLAAMSFNLGRVMRLLYEAAGSDYPFLNGLLLQVSYQTFRAKWEIRVKTVVDMVHVEFPGSSRNEAKRVGQSQW